MNGEAKYGDVALGVEAAMPALNPHPPRGHGLALLHRTLIWLCASLRRWA
jgi:hypothetical protein